MGEAGPSQSLLVTTKVMLVSEAGQSFLRHSAPLALLPIASRLPGTQTPSRIAEPASRGRTASLLKTAELDTPPLVISGLGFFLSKSWHFQSYRRFLVLGVSARTLIQAAFKPRACLLTLCSDSRLSLT